MTPAGHTARAPLPRCRLRPIRRDEEDARLIFAWRNDPMTRAHSFRGEEKSWSDFWPDYLANYFDAGVPAAQIVMEGEAPVGFVGFERARLAPENAGAVEISINIAPDHRHRGLGRRSLAEAAALLRTAGWREVHALVKPDNAASLRLFAAAGYADRGPARVAVEGVEFPVEVRRFVLPLRAGGRCARAGLSPTTRAAAGAVSLAPYLPEHVTEEVVRWLNDPDVVRYTEARYVAHTAESQRAYVAAANGDPSARLWRIMVAGEGHVGTLRLSSIDRRHGHARVALIVGRKDLWGQGIAQRAIAAACGAAIGELGLRKLLAGIYASNTASLRAFAKAGFVEEARLARQYRDGDELVDGVIMSRFADRAES